MQGNGNKIIAVLFLVMLFAVVIMAVGASSGGSSGGGDAVRGVETAQDGSRTTTSSTELQQDATGRQGTTSTEYAPMDDEITLEQLEALLSTDMAPVGDNVRDAYTSANVPAANAVYAVIEKRGFENIEVEADFNINGEYSESHVLEPSSTEVYPSYSFEYMSASDVLWIIFVNDGAYYAVPLGSGSNTVAKQIILSESDYVTQYDGMKNEYSDFPLNGMDGAVGVRVDAIDAVTLDAYTIEQLNAM